MFGKKKERSKRDHNGKNLAQYGLFDVPSNFDTGLDNAGVHDDDDSDLEAELAALAGDGGGQPKARPKKKLPLMPENEFNAMVAESMRDVPSDDDVSVDENDPELLGELSELAEPEVAEGTPSPTEPPSTSPLSNISAILTERLHRYEQAEKNAKESGETSKARRFGRAIKTLKSLISQAQKGATINLNDDSIPPDINMADKKLQPSRPAPPLPSSVEQPTTPPRGELEPTPLSPPTEEPTPSSPPVLPDSVQENVEKQNQGIDQELFGMLTERQKQYKLAALAAKKSGDAQTAIKFVKVAKQFEAVMEAVKNGQEVDLSNMPGPPGEAVEENRVQKDSIPEIPVPEEAANLPEPTLITASTVLEALEQRLAVYQQHETEAKEQGNSSKARRYGRIAKQYQDAIKLHKAGKAIPFDELPTPPGYGPIPGTAQPAAAAPPTPAPAPAAPATEESGGAEGGSQKPSPNSNRISGNRVSTTHADKQVLILMAKQKQFKQAALNAKKKGEITEAKEFLRQAKGFDRLLEAARAGLPVDWSSIPVSPEGKSQLANEYDIVMADDCSEDSTGDMDILARLENQLQKQLKMCLTTRDHNKALGDVAGANRFERLGLNVAKDLDFVRMAKKKRTIPRFHYETKEFAIVKCFTDILDNTIEVTVHRGINYQSENPKDIDTYVKLEFPFPQDTPFSDRTSTIKDTNNPEYNKTFVIPIQRNSRQCQRVFKRHGVKFEVYSKGCCGGASDVFCCYSGFFRGDSLIGTVNVKLQPLETQCEIHDSFDLMEGRKKVGGKLEVQMKLRTPIVTQQVEQIQEKWLILDP